MRLLAIISSAVARRPGGSAGSPDQCGRVVEQGVATKDTFGCRAVLNDSPFVDEGVSARRSFCCIVWNVPFAVMDTIIFAGLLGALVAIWQERSRSVTLGVWAVVTVLTAVLLNHHVTS